MGKRTVSKCVSIPSELDISIRAWAERNSMSYSASVVELVSRCLDCEIDAPIAPRVHEIVRHEGEIVSDTVEYAVKDATLLLMAGLEEATSRILFAMGSVPGAEVPEEFSRPLLANGLGAEGRTADRATREVASKRGGFV